MSELLMAGDVARECAVTPATVRLWERMGKLPAVRTASGVRVFQRVDVDRIKTERSTQAYAGGRQRNA